MKDKQNKLIIAGFLVLVIVCGSLIIFRARRKASQKKSSLPLTPTPAINKFTNVTEPDLEINLDGTRTTGTLTISKIDSQFSGLEYELTYQSKIGGTTIERGIYSGGAIPIPSSRKISRDLFFGTKSCTTGKCRVRAEKVEIDQPATLTIRLLNDQKEIWELEKTVLFKPAGSGFKGVFQK